MSAKNLLRMHRNLHEQEAATKYISILCRIFSRCIIPVLSSVVFTHGHSCRILLLSPVVCAHGPSCPILLLSLVVCTHGRSCPVLLLSSVGDIGLHIRTGDLWKCW